LLSWDEAAGENAMNPAANPAKAAINTAGLNEKEKILPMRMINNVSKRKEPLLYHSFDLGDRRPIE
jgi:hypothetical protein